jgi:hypothetical protein
MSDRNVKLHSHATSGGRPKDVLGTRVPGDAVVLSGGSYLQFGDPQIESPDLFECEHADFS